MTHTPHSQPIQILLVEDNPDDAALTVETLQEGKLLNQITVVEDGAEAMDYLNRQGEHTDASKPDLILLDLQLPKKSGREVLSEIKQDSELRRIPVIILTTSSAEKDIFESYDLHANCYITKPIDLNDFINAVREIENFWLSLVKLSAA